MAGLFRESSSPAFLHAALCVTTTTSSSSSASDKKNLQVVARDKDTGSASGPKA